MSTNPVLSHIQTMFPGQTVLYAKDMAKLLSRSEKAISHLLNRGQLPFKVKKIGGRWCTDIFSVQQWFEEDGFEFEVEVSPCGVSQPTTSTRSNNPGGRISVAADLFEMRHRAALMRRLVDGLSVKSESQFILEVAACMLFNRHQAKSKFIVTGTRLGAQDSSSETEERKFMHDTPNELAACVAALKLQWRSAEAARIVVHAGRKQIYDASRFGGADWLPLKDDLKLG